MGNTSCLRPWGHAEPEPSLTQFTYFVCVSHDSCMNGLFYSDIPSANTTNHCEVEQGLEVMRSMDPCCAI
jgi:hypothetical protein